MPYVFGPVPSRRLGFSLGIDPIPFKTCTLNCIYCQLGRTIHLTLRRKEYIPREKILKEIGEILAREKKIDYITFSGSGEPTLNSKIGKMIEGIKRITDIPVAIITNGTLLSNRNLWEELKTANVIIPSLDAATQNVFERINRPHPELKISEIIKGMAEFRKKHGGEIWLEIMIVKGINDNLEELTALKKAIGIINPHRVQLNTPVRPPAEEWVRVLNSGELERIKDFLGAPCEVIAEFRGKEQKSHWKDVEKGILTLISRRPVTVDDISSSLGIHLNEVIKYIESLEKEGRISSRIYQGKRYFIGVKERR